MGTAGSLRVDYSGTGFTYDVNGNAISGTITQIRVIQSNAVSVEFSDLQISVSAFRTFVGTGNVQGFLSSVLAGDDTISHPGDGGEFDAFDGFAGNDSIDGNAGNDTLRGGTGNDTLIGGVGVDSLIGGAGNDKYVVDDASDIVDENGGGGIDTVVVETSLFNLFTNGRGNIENLVLGVAGNIAGDDLNNRITGSGGNDTLNGNSGNDTVDGGDGDDSIFGGFDNDQLLGGDGNDTLSGNLGSDTMIGGLGDDIYIVDDRDNVVETLIGTLGGEDLVRYSATRGTYTLGANLENLVLISGIAGTGNALGNDITGNAFGNRLLGLAGDDALQGDVGNDTLDGGSGADSLLGGTESDVYIVDNILDSIEEAIGDPSVDTVRSSVTFSLNPADGRVTGDVETLILTGMAAINGTGNGLANALTGNSAKNTLLGLGGDDTLNGGGGADTLEGGSGNDTYIAGSKAVQIRELGGDLGDAVVAGFSVDLSSVQFAEIESVQLTGSMGLSATGNDARNRLTGNAGANRLAGGGADDTLEGGNGNDTLDGGTGDDGLVGGAGNDIYLIDSDSDVVKGEEFTGGIDTIHTTVVDTTLGEGVEHLVLFAGAESGRGNSGNNRMTGNDGANTLIGAGGNDTLTGGGGEDLLDGGTGKDAMNGGLGNDTYGADDGDSITESVGGAAGGIDEIIYVGSKGYALGANIENLVLDSSSGDSFGTGNGLANTITGNEFDNRLLGMGGNDTLIGGGGDSLDGGTGADSMIGGGDFDLFVVDNVLDAIDDSKGGIFIDAVHSSVSFNLTENGTTVIGRLEDLVLTGSKAINGTGNEFRNTIEGNGAANILDGGNGFDLLAGGGGNDSLIGGADANGDILDGGAGADTMDGGEGDDQYTVDNMKDLVIEHDGLFGGLDVVTATVSHTLNGEIENLVLAGKAANGTGNFLDNRINGTQTNNVLRGLEGNDSLFGEAGNDTLDGGIGADSLSGGKGNDVYRVDQAGDVVDESFSDGVDTVIATASYSLSPTTAADIENLTLAAGAGNINGAGNGGDNRITGNEGQNDMDGEEGNDTILGGASRDFLNGGAGNDSLDGGTGDDFFFGDIGDDTMGGGAGTDVFFYSTVLDGHDLIRGFDGNPSAGQDILDLEDLFNALGAGTEPERAARVQLTDRGANVDVRVDTDNNGSFDLFVATLQTADTITVSGDLSLGG